MKKKIIIIVSLVVLLALGGTFAFAAVDGEGSWINPFSNILNGKVEDGTITREDADTFANVWEAIKGDVRKGRPDGYYNMKECPEFSAEFIEELKEAMTVKRSEILGELTAAGYITAEEAQAVIENKLNIGAFLKNADEETISAVKEAMEGVREYMADFINEKVEDGTITQEQADIFLKRKTAGRGISPGRRPKAHFGKRGPCRYNDTEESEGPGA